MLLKNANFVVFKKPIHDVYSLAVKDVFDGLFHDPLYGRFNKESRHETIFPFNALLRNPDHGSKRTFLWWIIWKGFSFYRFHFIFFLQINIIITNPCICRYEPLSSRTHLLGCVRLVSFFVDVQSPSTNLACSDISIFAWLLDEESSTVSKLRDWCQYKSSIVETWFIKYCDSY